MRALYYECFSGISGDMHIGALVDLGVPADYLNAQLARLNVANEFELRLERASKHGISGTQATVVLAPDAERPHRHLRHVKAIIESAQLAPKVTAQALNILGIPFLRLMIFLNGWQMTNGYPQSICAVPSLPRLKLRQAVRSLRSLIRLITTLLPRSI